jgi:polyphosphate kinase 2 (PPK2 family)
MCRYLLYVFLENSMKEENKEKTKLKRKHYEKELRRLQEELCQLQDWVKAKGLRIVVVFEGRDGAGHESWCHKLPYLFLLLTTSDIKLPQRA